jgi:hypothetical protein
MPKKYMKRSFSDRVRDLRRVELDSHFGHSGFISVPSTVTSAFLAMVGFEYYSANIYVEPSVDIYFILSVAPKWNIFLTRPIKYKWQMYLSAVPSKL